jgi:DNA-binding transcriptional ArsR family regulator
LRSLHMESPQKSSHQALHRILSEPERFYRALRGNIRRDILTLFLDDKARPVAQVAAHFSKITMSVVARHLVLLADSGLLDRQREGKQVWYRLSDKW